jgi:hypothetical protein
MNSLTKAVALVVLALAGTGLLPKFVLAIRTAQIHLIEETKASKWGKAPLLDGTLPH